MRYYKNYYLYLVYDNGEYIYYLRDVEAFRKQYQENIGLFNASKLRPMTYAELIYVATYFATRDKYAYVTRYPAIEIGSTVPCKVHLGTTSPSRKVKLTETGFGETDYRTLPEYPVLGASFVDSTILHPSILKGLGADFDGDTVSVNGVISVEANEEIRKHLSSKERFIHANGSLFPKRTDLIDLTIFNLSRDPVN